MLLRTSFFYSSSKIKCLSRVYFSTVPTFKEQKIKVKNFEINYLRVGRGSHHVLLTPGVLGTIWNDFGKQIEGFDHDKFSLVVWDPPGYGKSIILDDNDSLDIYRRGASIAYELMKALQIERYSLLGWSFGGTCSYLLAARNPDVVNKLVVFSCGTFLRSHEIEFYRKIRDISKWSKVSRETMIKLYGKDNFIKKYSKIVDALETIYETKTVYCEDAKRVKCPTLILSGGKDVVLDTAYHHKYLHHLIENSRAHVYPNGRHDLHIQYADDFNKRVQEYLLESNKNGCVNEQIIRRQK